MSNNSFPLTLYPKPLPTTTNILEINQETKKDQPKKLTKQEKKNHSRHIPPGLEASAGGPSSLPDRFDAFGASASCFQKPRGGGFAALKEGALEYGLECQSMVRIVGFE